MCFLKIPIYIYGMIHDILISIYMYIYLHILHINYIKIQYDI